MAAKKKKKKKAAPKKKKKAAPKPVKKKPRPTRVSAAVETFPEGEEGIDLVCVAKAAKKVHVQAIAVNPTGRFVIAGDMEKGCRVIDIERGAIRSLARAKGEVNAIAFLEREVAIVGDATGILRVVDLRSDAEHIVTLPGTSRMTKLAAANGVAAYGFVSGPAFTWRSATEPPRALPGYSGHVCALAIDDAIVCVSKYEGSEATSVAVHVWDVKSGAALRTLTADATGFVSDMLIAGKHIVVVTDGGDVLAWNEAGKLTARASLPAMASCDCASVLDGSPLRVAVAQGDTVTIVDVTTGASTTATMRADWNAQVARGNTAVVAPHDGNLGVCDLVTGKLLLEKDSDAVRYAALADDRVTVAVCNDKGDVAVYRAHPPH
jgi:hypothetical protein